MDADRLDLDPATGEQTVDDSHRRAFKPPRRRRRPKRTPTGPTVNLWDMRDGLGYGFTRAVCAIGFGLTPIVEERFGDAGFILVAAALGALMVTIVAALMRMGRAVEWRLLADAMTLIVLTPTLVTASGIEVADARLGGRSTNFLAAAAATILIYMIVVIVATRAGSIRTVASQIGALPGALSITAVLLGTSHFSAGALWRGLALAWMVAAAVTVLAMFVSLRARIAVTPATLVLCTLGVIFVESSNGGGRSLSSESAGIAMAAAAAVAIIVVFIPLPQRRARVPRRRSRWAPPTNDRPFNS